jgi:hypothetical protein
MALASVLNMVNMSFTMLPIRPSFAAHPRLFGRGPARFVSESNESGYRFSDDVKLFAATFIAGFLFVSILIG